MVSMLISNGVMTIREESETVDHHIARHEKAIKETKN